MNNYNDKKQEHFKTKLQVGLIFGLIALIVKLVNEWDNVLIWLKSLF